MGLIELWERSHMRKNGTFVEGTITEDFLVRCIFVNLMQFLRFQLMHEILHKPLRVFSTLLVDDIFHKPLAHYQLHSVSTNTTRCTLPLTATVAPLCHFATPPHHLNSTKSKSPLPRHKSEVPHSCLNHDNNYHQHSSTTNISNTHVPSKPFQLDVNNLCLVRY